MIEANDCVDRSGDGEPFRNVGSDLKSTRIDSSRRRLLPYAWFQLVRASKGLDCIEGKGGGRGHDAG